jgi:putative ABC transport system permease protein
MFLKLALRNIVRQRLRTAMTLAAIVVSVVGLILSAGFVQDIFVQLGEAVIHSQSGHLQIARQGYFDEGSRKPERYLIADPDPLVRSVAALAGVDDVMARLKFAGLLNNGKADLSIVGEGIEPDKETRLGTYLTLRRGRMLTTADRYAILLGEGVAHSLQLAPGDRATCLVVTPDGAMNVLEFDVVGVFASFSKDYDARTVKIPLKAARELLDTTGANALVVRLGDTDDTESVAAAAGALIAKQGLELRRWQDLNDFYNKTVDLYDRQLGVLRVIVLLMVLLSVTNTINMAVYERTGEFGTMRAMGNRSRYLFSLLLTESALLGLIGALVGVVVGIGLAKVISDAGIPMPPPPNANVGYVAQIRVLPGAALSAMLVAVAATVAACVLPAWRITRLSIVDALRQND